MEPGRRTLSSLRRHARNWRRAYESVLQQNDKNGLVNSMEVAEAAILTRREELQYSSNHHAERQAMEEALAHLQSLKQNRLGFNSMEA